MDQHTYVLEEQKQKEGTKKWFIVRADRIRGMESTIAVLLDINRRRARGVTFDLENNQVKYIEARTVREEEWGLPIDSDW